MQSNRKFVLDMEPGAQEPPQVVPLQKKGASWRLGGLAAIATLCIAGAVLFTMHGQVSHEGDQDEDLRHTLRQISLKAKAAIHLEGEYNSKLSNDSAVWHSEVGQAFAQGGLKLEDNNITVSQSGLYFVYSQASFRINCHKASRDSHEQFLHLSHTVMRWSESYGGVWKPLLSSVRSACKKVETEQDTGEHWFNSIYLGAVFSLNRGDKLHTMSNEKLLEHLEGEDGKTFFGVFAL
ncbi:tumor necrosis factor a (TNF superfamily, member 2) [Brienomyrus brachyistius]|uniref:tumor necrosis factor a (TNF superfamily, member 2) n=1 Tax=Brienomyrus brachyistius TaxID=42636 RepID=UPI0020B26F3C|nr:tumor necrosis factor a (TNF superfamily, member 2) [Brienomyrus brachyistius]